MMVFEVGRVYLLTLCSGYEAVTRKEQHQLEPDHLTLSVNSVLSMYLAVLANGASFLR